MRKYPLLIIGGGLSGLAAAIRFARFGQKVLILEKHSKPGGLNSYYYRKGQLLETGLHAITNFAPPEDKHAPLNRLLRQLKIPRRTLGLLEQQTSEILFPGRASLCFSNDFSMLQSQVAKRFPDSSLQFTRMLAELDKFDPFTPHPKVSARKFVASFLQDRLLCEMLFCPVMFYGGSDEDDMDLSQFVILLRSIFQEGFFRPEGTIKDFLDLLLEQYKNFGGELELSTGVQEIITENNRVAGVRTDAGEKISCNYLISTAGFPETKRLFSTPEAAAAFSGLHENKISGRLSFTESIYLLNNAAGKHLPRDRTIIFYNLSEKFSYRRPHDAVDLSSGVICFPGNFQGREKTDIIQLRVTHLANYEKWRQAYDDDDESRYAMMKKDWNERSKEVVGKIIGNCEKNIVYEDTFTPVTIERYTSRSQGAVYGSPEKIKDGRTNFENLYIAGTDQGYLGIVGSLLSGVTMVNQHILNKI
ncbi:MAG: phytoene dehydrogenase [Desulfobacterales bacterium SG8_35]|nr:MAG: phytoene dehydrogenase [Desulfobacterales bacterium SG8_35]